MEEAAEKGKESSHSAHANGMNGWMDGWMDGRTDRQLKHGNVAIN
jgi:hypothetical protein